MLVKWGDAYAYHSTRMAPLEFEPDILLIVRWGGLLASPHIFALTISNLILLFACEHGKSESKWTMAEWHH